MWKRNVILNSLILVFVPWILFIISDALYEIDHNSIFDVIENVVIWAMPIVSMIVGIIVFGWTKVEGKCKASHVALYSVLIEAMNIAISMLTIHLIDKNFWIIPQKSTPGYISLNGIEYGLFGFFLFLAYTVVVIYMIIYSVVVSAKTKKK